MHGGTGCDHTYKQHKLLLLLAVVLLSFTSCYRPTSRLYISLGNGDSTTARDTLHAMGHRAYCIGDNFIVHADSLNLLRQQPEEEISNLHTDTLAMRHHDILVVADIRCIPQDSIDSVWVQVARDQQTWGWLHESDLLKSVVPDDPISQFIYTFSNIHLLIFLIVIILIAAGYLVRKLLRRSSYIVHMHDIDSPYPMATALIVATAATLYASIQMFAPQQWQVFYYHPTLNPFSVSALLAVFLCLVWAIIIVGLAAIDDVTHKLPHAEALLYLCGLLAVCAVDYIVFSISTLYYVGYPLLLLYFLFAIHRHAKEARRRNNTSLGEHTQL